MNKLALSFLLLLFIGKVFCQEVSWISKVDMTPTEECIDSLTCYTKVAIEVNTLALTDSTKIFINVGRMPGGNDIYSKTITYLPGIENQPDISIINNVLKVMLGKYITGTGLHVNIWLE